MARRTVSVETETSDHRPPWAGSELGTAKLFREDPAGGYLETVDAGPLDEEYIKHRWGGGLFKVQWFPPPEAEDQEPKTYFLDINAPIKKLARDKLAGAEGGDPATAMLLADIRREMLAERREREEQARRTNRFDDEWGKLLQTQRENDNQTIGKVVSILGQFYAASSEQHEARQREAEQRFAQMMERERLYHQQTLQMMEATRAREGAGGKLIENLGELGQLLEVVKSFSGGEAAESTTATIVKALPGIAEGIGGGFANFAESYSKAVRSAKEARAMRQQPAQLPGPVEGDPFGVGGEAPDVHPAGEAPEAPRVVHDQAADEEPDDAGEDDPWLDTDEGRQFSGWLDYMEGLPDSRWLAKIQADYQTGDLPAALVGPLQAAFLREDWEPLLELFARAGASDLLDRALRAGGNGAGNGNGSGRGVGSAGGAVAPVEVAPEGVADGGGPGAAAGAAEDRGRAPGAPGSAGDGAADSEELPRPK